MKYYAGLDISDKITSICVMDQDRQITLETVVETEPQAIIKALQHFACKVIGIESGSLTHYLVTELRKADLPAVCIDSRQMGELLKLNINKTDLNDARAISEALRCGYYKEVYVKSPKAAAVHALLTGRKTLVNQRTTIKNSIRGLLKSQGIRLKGACHSTFIKTP